MKFLLFRWVSMGNGWLSVPSKKSQCIEPPPSQVIPCAAEDSGGRWQRDIEILNLQHSQLWNICTLDYRTLAKNYLNSDSDSENVRQEMYTVQLNSNCIRSPYVPEACFPDKVYHTV